MTFGSKTYLMTRDAGGSWGKGVTFRWSGKLPAGTHSVVFSAKAKNNGDATVAAGSVTIAAPAAPDPTPKPPAKPKPVPTPTPRSIAEPRSLPSPPPTLGPRPGIILPTPTPSSTDPLPALNPLSPDHPFDVLVAAVVIVPKPGGPGSPRGGSSGPGPNGGGGGGSGVNDGSAHAAAGDRWPASLPWPASRAPRSRHSASLRRS